MTMTEEKPADTSGDSTGDDLIDGLCESERLIARVTSARSLMLATAYERALAASEGRSAAGRDLAIRSAAAELAASARMSEHLVRARMAAGHALVTLLPSVQRAWSAGLISERQALLIEEFGSRIACDERRAEFADAALEAASRMNSTRLRRVLMRLAEEAEEVPLDARHEHAAKDRRVWVEDGRDGMSTLCALGPSHLVHAAFDRIREHAKRLGDLAAVPNAGVATSVARPADEHLSLDGMSSDRGRGAMAAVEPVPASIDPRSFGARMVDTVFDLLLTSDSAQIVQRADGGAPRIDARVAIAIPFLSAAGASDDPAKLLGVGPMPASAARQYASAAPSLMRLLTDPLTEAPIAADRRLPTPAMRATLAVRDERCRFPGCTRQPLRCDIDHTIDYALGGRTELGNLAHLCRWHHVLKHQSAWSVEQLADGFLAWTSPSGRVFLDSPAHREPRFGPRFAPSDEGPAEPPGPPCAPEDGWPPPPGAPPAASKPAPF